jgi:predicted Rossmann fold nucleotide-binding protein DprA/Smf involved in DNA uptake
MRLHKRIGIVGSREFKNYKQLCNTVAKFVENEEDEIISGGAVGADSMAQRYAKEFGLDIQIKYPKYARYGKGATFRRNKTIVEHSDVILAFYRKGHFQEGGTANTADWARKLKVELHEYEEEQ